MRLDIFLKNPFTIAYMVSVMIGVKYLLICTEEISFLLYLVGEAPKEASSTVSILPSRICMSNFH